MVYRRVSQFTKEALSHWDEEMLYRQMCTAMIQDIPKEDLEKLFALDKREPEESTWHFDITYEVTVKIP